MTENTEAPKPGDLVRVTYPAHWNAPPAESTVEPSGAYVGESYVASGVAVVEVIRQCRSLAGAAKGKVRPVAVPVEAKPVEEQRCSCGSLLADHGWDGSDTLTCPPPPSAGQDG